MTIGGRHILEKGGFRGQRVLTMEELNAFVIGANVNELGLALCFEET